MQYKLHTSQKASVVEVTSVESPIASVQDFLDLIANIPGDHIILAGHMLHPDFFDLKTRLAGEILQKVSNYRIKLGITGDFSSVSSQSLKDFIYESNKQGHVVFQTSPQDILTFFEDE